METNKATSIQTSVQKARIPQLQCDFSEVKEEDDYYLVMIGKIPVISLLLYSPD